MKYPKQETLRLRRLSRPFYFGIFMLEQVEISLVSTAVTPNFLPHMDQNIFTNNSVSTNLCLSIQQTFILFTFLQMQEFIKRILPQGTKFIRKTRLNTL